MTTLSLFDVLTGLRKPVEETAQLTGLQPASLSVDFQKSGATDASKLAHALSALDRLASLVGELRASHLNGIKVAAALTGAIKLAQDGAIDLEDVFETARKALQNGSVKLSAAGEAYTAELGELVGPARELPVQANGPHVTGYSYPDGEVDVLTAALRSLRRA